MYDPDLHADIISTHILMNLPHDDDLADLSLAEAYDLADRVAARLEKPLGGFAGYKVSWNTPALMARFGLPHPGFGRVFQNQVHHGSAALKLEDFRDFMFEPEIVAVLGSDIKPGEDHTAASVADKVARLSAGFELLDRRGFPTDPPAGAQILAHNVFNAGAVVGLGRVAPYDVDVASLTTRVQKNGDMMVESEGLAPQDPLEAIAFLARHYCGRGRTMRAGQIILCGAHMPIQPVTEPSRINLSMGRLGTAEIELR